jgi:hypothetical protein
MNEFLIKERLSFGKTTLVIIKLYKNIQKIVLATTQILYKYTPI